MPGAPLGCTTLRRRPAAPFGVTSLRRVPAPDPVTPDDARAFLAQHLEQDVGPVSLVGEGMWSRSFGFSMDGLDLVIRFGPHRDDFEKDRRATTFNLRDVPVPHVFAIGEAFGGSFTITERAAGTPLSDLDVAGWRGAIPIVFSALDDIRSLDVSEQSGWGEWDATGTARQRSWRDHLLSVETDTIGVRLRGWRQRLRDAPGGDAIFRAGFEELSHLTHACPDERWLVHGSLMGDNARLQSGRLSAVTGWRTSLYGDFLYDFASIEFWAPTVPALEGVHLRGLYTDHLRVTGQKVPDLDSRITCYMIHAALEGMAASAYRGDLATLAATTARLIPLIR